MKKVFLFGLFLCLLFFSGCHRIARVHAPGDLPPVTVQSYAGYADQGKKNTQVYTAIPKRVYAVSEAVVDNFFFLGLEDRITAVSECPVDSRLPHTERYRRFWHFTENYGYPSREAVLDLRPDLIISWGSLFGDSALGSVDYWQKKGIHTYLMTNTVPKSAGSRKVKNIIVDLKNLAAIFRIEKESAAKIENLAARIERLEKAAAQIPPSRRRRVMTLQNIFGNEYYSRSQFDMTSDMIRLAGGESLDDDFGGRQSIENIIKNNPEAILVVDMPPRRTADKKIAALKRRRLLQKVEAIKRGRFFIVPYRSFYCGSELTVEVTEKLREFLAGLESGEKDGE